MNSSKINWGNISNRVLFFTILFSAVLISIHFINKQFVFDDIYVLKNIDQELKVHYPRVATTIFYVIQRIGDLIPISEGGVRFARVFNALLLILNGILFYRICRFRFPGFISNLGMLLFIFTPVVFFNSVMIKPDSILLIEVLLMFLLCLKYLESEKKGVYAFWSGFVGVLPFFTKYNPFAVLLFFSALYLNKTDRKKNFLSFCGGGLVSGLPLLFFNRDILIDVYNGAICNDNYFVSAPNISSAVNEWSAFPFDPIGLPFLLIFPASFGVINYLFFIFALLRKKISKRDLFLIIPFTLAHVIFYLSITYVRFPWIYTVIAPFIIFGSLFVWEMFFKNQKKIFLPALGVVFILLHMSNATNLSQFIFNYQDEIAKISSDKLLPGVKGIHFTQNPKEDEGYWLKELKDPENKYILIFDALVDQYCRYQKNEVYIKTCKEMRLILEEKTEWKFKSVKDLAFIKFFGFEFKHRSYLFVRKDLK